MATAQCKDCPSSCLGHDLSDLCIHHEGTGESIKSIIDRLDSQTSSAGTVNSTVTTDDVISTAYSRSTGSLCASNIIKRDYTYSLSASQTGTTFSWNLTDFAANLPTNYAIATVRVRVVGKSSSGNNVVADSSSLSAGLSITLDKYPITVDFLIRVTSPCGNIDLESKVMLTNPTQTGDYRANLVAQDLNPSTTSTDLTSQLNKIESDVFDLNTKVQSISVTSDGNAVNVLAANNAAEIGDINSILEDPSSFDIQYVNDGVTKEDELKDIITDLYGKIKELQDTVLQQQVKIDSLEANS